MSLNNSELAVLLDKARRGDLRATGKLLTIMEDPYRLPPEFFDMVASQAGRAHVIGVTGIPGAGKSTLISRLIPELRRRGARVAVIAIDPTSPISGGALLGDRLRMQDHAMDPGVFIRSVSTRGLKGGLSLAALSMIELFDALGYEKILVETVGVGQAEVDIMSAAHTILVVTMPGVGDDVQALKAGVMEIGDIYVLNKSDLPDAQKAYEYLSFALDKGELGSYDSGWTPKLFKVSAVMGQGMAELADAIDEHASYIRSIGLARLKVASRRLTLIRLMSERMLTVAVEEEFKRVKAELEAKALKAKGILAEASEVARRACKNLDNLPPT